MAYICSRILKKNKKYCRLWRNWLDAFRSYLMGIVEKPESIKQLGAILCRFESCQPADEPRKKIVSLVFHGGIDRIGAW